MATRAPKDRGRRGSPPLVLLGVVVIIALVVAYLSDCIPGLGSGADPGTPSSPATPTPPEAPAAVDGAGDARVAITVQGDRCRRGQAPAAPCPEVCAALDRTHAATLEVAIEATEGRHGTVEELRQCLQQAGFTNVRVHAD